MKETKFTKGDWELTLSGGKSSVWCGERQITREMFFSFPLIDDREERLANEHLIKTAPKLYAFIESLQLSVADDIKRDELLAEARGEQ